MVFLGETIECQVLAGSRLVTMKVPITEEITEGEEVFLRFAPEACLVLPEESL